MCVHFDHATGKGWVAANTGKSKPPSYADALSKANLVRPMIVETSGASSARSLKSTVHPCAARARGPRARDSTVYGASRSSARSYALHHTQRISLGIVKADSRGILDSFSRLSASLSSRA